MGGSRHAGQPAGLKTVPFTQRCEEYKRTFGVSRVPGFKDPTTEANVRRAIIFRSGGVFAFQGPLRRFPLSHVLHPFAIVAEQTAQDALCHDLGFRLARIPHVMGL
jgi:hypothetical protein